MSGKHTNSLSFTTTTAAAAATKTTTNDVKLEFVNVLLNAAVQIVACTVPTATHEDKCLKHNNIVVAESQVEKL